MKLSEYPLIHPTAATRDCSFGRYTEIDEFSALKNVRLTIPVGQMVRVFGRWDADADCLKLLETYTTLRIGNMSPIWGYWFWRPSTL